jgi:predicted DNA-binding transcriptional regulator AlpA
MARLIRTPDVAAKLGLSVEVFYRRRAQLAQAGFPPPCAPFRNRWSEAVVDAWINRASAPAATADREPDRAPPDNDITAWSKTLSERARAANL